jgi:hypothetical protein
MSKNTLYIYFLGTDFCDFVDIFVKHADQFIQSRTWICPDIWTVNQRRTARDGVPEWELGLNLDLPDPHQEPPGWFTDVEEIVIFCIACRTEFRHDIEIGISDNERQHCEAIIEITAEPPDLDYLRDFIGIAPP